jgi:hypothetical protein
VLYRVWGAYVQGPILAGVPASALIAIFICVMLTETSGNIALKGLNFKRPLNELKAKVYICLREIKECKRYKCTECGVQFRSKSFRLL